jgi:hypothetical protein
VGHLLTRDETTLKFRDRESIEVWAMPETRERRWMSFLCMLSVSAGLLLGEAHSALCQARDSAAAAAQAVGTAFLNAVRAADWKAAAAFLDIVPLDHYRLAEIDMMRRTRSQPPMTAERLMSENPKLPRAVAEYEVAQMNEHRGRANVLEYEFGISDPDSLAALPASIVAQRWLEVHDPRWQLRKAFERSNCGSAALDSMPGPAFRVLGTVVADPVAYLLYERDNDPPMGPDNLHGFGPRMLTLRRGMDGWWVLPRMDPAQGFAMMSRVECATKRTK